jgi:hypothetical protein
VPELGARIVHNELLAHPEPVERTKEISRVPRLAGSKDLIRDVAVADLLPEALLTPAADGCLCVRPRRPS